MDFEQVLEKYSREEEDKHDTFQRLMQDANRWSTTGSDKADEKVMDFADGSLLFFVNPRKNHPLSGHLSDLVKAFMITTREIQHIEADTVKHNQDEFSKEAVVEELRDRFDHFYINLGDSIADAYGEILDEEDFENLKPGEKGLAKGQTTLD